MRGREVALGGVGEFNQGIASFDRKEAERAMGDWLYLRHGFDAIESFFAPEIDGLALAYFIEQPAKPWLGL